MKTSPVTAALAVTEPHEYRISFRLFSLGELRERLELAGLHEVDTDYDDARDRYAVTAVAAVPDPEVHRRSRRVPE